MTEAQPSSQIHPTEAEQRTIAQIDRISEMMTQKAKNIGSTAIDPNETLGYRVHKAHDTRLLTREAPGAAGGFTPTHVQASKDRLTGHWRLKKERRSDRGPSSETTEYLVVATSEVADPAGQKHDHLIGSYFEVETGERRVLKPSKKGIRRFKQEVSDVFGAAADEPTEPYRQTKAKVDLDGSDPQDLKQIRKAAAAMFRAHRRARHDVQDRAQGKNKVISAEEVHKKAMDRFIDR